LQFIEFPPLLVRPGLDGLPLLVEFDVALITDLKALLGAGLGGLGPGLGVHFQFKDRQDCQDRNASHDPPSQAGG